MASVTGSISIKHDHLYHTLQFAGHGWMAADMVQYLDDLYQAEDPEVEILKLLGYTMEISSSQPSRKYDHWVEIDLKERVLATNSTFIRRAVRQEPPGDEEPYLPMALRNVHEVLDRFDFTVQLFPR